MMKGSLSYFDIFPFHLLKSLSDLQWFNVCKKEKKSASRKFLMMIHFSNCNLI